MDLGMKFGSRDELAPQQFQVFFNTWMRLGDLVSRLRNGPYRTSGGY